MLIEIAENKSARSGPRNYAEIVLDALYDRYKHITEAQEAVQAATMASIVAGIPRTSPLSRVRSTQEES